MCVCVSAMWRYCAPGGIAFELRSISAAARSPYGSFLIGGWGGGERERRSFNTGWKSVAAAQGSLRDFFLFSFHPSFPSFEGLSGILDNRVSTFSMFRDTWGPLPDFFLLLLLPLLSFAPSPLVNGSIPSGRLELKLNRNVQWILACCTRVNLPSLPLAD